MTWLIEALLPEFCVLCKREGSVFCRSCETAWWPDPELTSLQERVDQLFSIGSYRDVVLQKLLGLWKYHNVKHAKEALLGIVAQTVGDYQSAIPLVEAVTFVPLHWRKKNERGFDQAEETARTVAVTLDVPCLSLLERIKYTAQQAQIDREQRVAQEFVGVFAQAFVTKVIPKRLLVIDDVWTTGTTLSAAAEVLRQAGAEQVSALTIAKG